MIRIAITGPESTGKSCLAQELATFYNTVWVPEFARTYIETLQRPYNQDDILRIAQGQLASEAEISKRANKFIFCDTELTVCKIWSLVKYGSCHEQLTHLYQNTFYDYYLLTDIDLPWEYDPQREHPNFRQELMNMYVNELTATQKPFSIIQGTGNQRLNNAINAIKVFFE